MAACGGGSERRQQPSTATPAAARGPVAVDKASYPVFPDADAGADPAVPAEQGGKGFKGEGWDRSTLANEKPPPGWGGSFVFPALVWIHALEA